MKRFFVILVLPVCFIALMSCKSGEKSGLEGVDVSQVTLNGTHEFLPPNCDPRDGVFSSVKLYKNSPRKLYYIELPDTCKFTDILDVKKLNNDPKTPAIRLTEGGSSLFAIKASKEGEKGDVEPWCVPYIGKGYLQYDELSFSPSAFDNCRDFINEQLKKGNITDEAIEKVFRKYGRNRVLLVAPVAFYRKGKQEFARGDEMWDAFSKSGYRSMIDKDINGLDFVFFNVGYFLPDGQGNYTTYLEDHAMSYRFERP